MSGEKLKRILVTGGAGYVGSALAHLLLREGFAVRVIDNLRWGGNALLGLLPHPLFEFQKGDIRNAEEVTRAVQGVDAVVHLAAIVGDPACKVEPKLAEETNYTASVQLFEAAKKARAQRFLFASTCSNYGKMKDPNGFCHEDSLLRPVSLYAELKVKFEQYLLTQDSLCVTPLRFATAYGLSPRMRFDLTVNEFTREAISDRGLVVFGEQFWRPYCHTTDLARACFFMLEAPKSKIHRQAFNVGDDDENYQKQTIVEEIRKQMPGFRFQYVHRDEDPRDYRVTFQKIRGLGFSISKKVPEGIREIAEAIRSGFIRDPYDKRYSNI